MRDGNSLVSTTRLILKKADADKIKAGRLWVDLAIFYGNAAELGLVYCLLIKKNI